MIQITHIVHLKKWILTKHYLIQIPNSFSEKLTTKSVEFNSGLLWLQV